MTRDMESASQPEKLTRYAVDPITRVEGHGKVTLLLDDERRVRQARLHIVEFRGFEKFIQQRPYTEVPVLVQRLCGICPVSHHLAGAKAVDMLAGYLPQDLTPTATKLRRLLHFGQTLQSHSLHFFHLSSPDLLFGFEDKAAHRQLSSVIEEHPDIALKGVKLRKFGQQVIQALCGKRIHGTFCLPGGVNKPLSEHQRQALLQDVDQVVSWAEGAVVLSRRLFLANADYHRQFGTVHANKLGMISPNGSLELYHGGLRLKDASGKLLADHINYLGYQDLIREEVKDWSYMKFPFIRTMGTERGWYQVGPLARINNCDFIKTPLAEEARREFMAEGDGGPVNATLAFHWARTIEALHCAESIRALLRDEAIRGTNLMSEKRPNEREQGIGVIEAPRGTLFHHYWQDADGLLKKANLIVSTTNNNTAMNESVRQVARTAFDGREVTEGLLNQVEVAIRAYDPCLSCATHALGKMPLRIEAINPDGSLLSSLIRNGTGSYQRPVSE
ncbi:Ni/Fe hydrogenase subunit alpha [Pseudohalioglobus sediminis]|uniref:Ni/Fe hydrogenase subunit alpha n=1 Tax=Pseudohalioglobus sediminis TaxID=2606449 RepID=A0A5B0WP25_9GAMM|nr:Ni/Fe hydrogenase subunit alpha [Pseudohalioglobus sediminis]KAA1187941.1 Ni/Fe hydrogenase subunit alpha [Pseudohalioglobus sediminis]